MKRPTNEALRVTRGWLNSSGFFFETDGDWDLFAMLDSTKDEIRVNVSDGALQLRCFHKDTGEAFLPSEVVENDSGELETCE